MHLTCKHIFHYIESLLKEFPAKNFKTRTISMSFSYSAASLPHFLLLSVPAYASNLLPMSCRLNPSISNTSILCEPEMYIPELPMTAAWTASSMVVQ